MMPTKNRRIATLVALLILFSCFDSSFVLSQKRGGAAARQANRPRLVLLIVVDQFRYDYLERFGAFLGPKGLQRLQREGASWVNTNYDHTPTYTAPGHATMMTGAYPAATGIIGNEWPDRETGKKVTSVTDLNAKILDAAGVEGASPRRLLASTLGDELRMATNARAKVIGISLKDRSAILPAGRHANAAYWFNAQSGSMVSSDYYFKQLPAWVTDFNKARPADKFFRARWDRVLPESDYLRSAGPDSPPWETIGNIAGDTNAFPHTITGGAANPNAAFYGALEYSPFANDLVLAFSEAAITNEQLGQDDDPDVLSVSFSANDYIGHRYGPQSQEVMDVTVRLDRQLSELLDFVDAHVGLRNTVVAFTADHGVAPIPEHAQALGLSGGRIAGPAFMEVIKAAIRERYNPHNKSPDPTVDYIYQYSDFGKLYDAFLNGNLYFNLTALKRDGVRVEEIEQLVGEAGLKVPGVARYFTRTQLLAGAVESNDPIARRVLHGFYPRRSGNVIFVSEPFQYLAAAIPATHGTPYAYDTHVPLIIMGTRIQPGEYLQPATPCDIAPTLAAILRIQPPSNVTGRILLEGMATR